MHVLAKLAIPSRVWLKLTGWRFVCGRGRPGPGLMAAQSFAGGRWGDAVNGTATVHGEGGAKDDLLAAGARGQGGIRHRSLGKQGRARARQKRGQLAEVFLSSVDGADYDVDDDPCVRSFHRR